MCIWTYQGERDERSPREHRVRDESRRWDGPMTLIGRGSETEGEGLPSVLRLDGAVENLVLDGTFVPLRLPRRRHVRERVVPSVGARRTADEEGGGRYSESRADGAPIRVRPTESRKEDAWSGGRKPATRAFHGVRGAGGRIKGRQVSPWLAVNVSCFSQRSSCGLLPLLSNLSNTVNIPERVHKITSEAECLATRRLSAKRRPELPS